MIKYCLWWRVHLCIEVHIGIHMYVYTLHCFDMKQTCVKYELDVDVAEFSLYSFQNFTCSMSRGRYYPGQISQLAQALLPSPLGAHHRYLIKIIIIIIIIIRVIIIIIIIIIGIWLKWWGKTNHTNLDVSTMWCHQVFFWSFYVIFPLKIIPVFAICPLVARWLPEYDHHRNQ